MRLRSSLNFLIQISLELKEFFETETTLYLVLELVTGGELLDKILEEKHFPEDKARNYFRQMLEAEIYLHAQDIAHLDLKPENILLKEPDSDIIKLSDFGLSRVVDQASFMKTICGTPQYVAPEILTSNRNEGYGLACDLWSSGVILYIMLVGYPPFSDTKPKPVFEQIKTGDYDFPKDYWSDISPSAIYLIKRLLTVDPRKRITAKEALESAWMRGLTHDENEKNNNNTPPPTVTQLSTTTNINFNSTSGSEQSSEEKENSTDEESDEDDFKNNKNKKNDSKKKNNSKKVTTSSKKEKKKNHHQ